jgi:MFS family permease
VVVLVIARTLQGVGGALLTPGGLAIIQATFRPEDRARAIGAWSALGGVAAAIGPLLGGYLAEAVSWRAIFLINLPLGGVVAGLALGHVSESRDEMMAGRLDHAGAVLATAGVAGATYAMVEGPSDGSAPRPRWPPVWGSRSSGVRRRRAARRAPDAAARDLRLTSVHGGQPRHLRRLRRAG